jgi:hypothetical protein
MRLASVIKNFAALLAIASQTQAADSTVYQDPTTGFTFSAYSAQYQLGGTLQYRIAVPSNATATAPYGAVIQVVAPIGVGWTALAWAGTMIRNPLTVSWASGNTPVVSSRWATAYSAPAMYPSATYQILSKGTSVNSTHWQYTALCTGCTSYTGSNNQNVIINPKDTNRRLAFAYSRNKPSGTSTSAPLAAHEVHTAWYHDLAAAANPRFYELVDQNR